jgi:outer membrane protein assembly factor BamB
MGVARAGIVATLVALAVGAAAAADSWPQFRGPTGQGHAGVGRVPTTWSETEHVRWKVPVPGLGWSSPVVDGGRVWLTTATGEDQTSLRLLGFDVATGREIVNTEVFRIRERREINPKNSRASPTPVVDGDRVYVHFGAEGTAAVATNGRVLWTRRFRYESQHGAGGSPILYGGALILSADGSDAAFVVALDAETGRVRWKRDRRAPWDQAYSTPLVIHVGEADQLVSIGAFRAAAYDPASGHEIWRVSYGDGFSNVPRPVFAHGLVFIATGFQQPALIAVRPDGTGDVTKTHVAWQLQRGVPLTPSPIVVGDELYMVTDGGVLSCVDARTGSILWQQRLGGTFSASPVWAGGHLYFSSEQGVTTVLEPGKRYQPIARNVIDGGMLASLAVAGESIIMRSDSALYLVAAEPQ